MQAYKYKVDLLNHNGENSVEGIVITSNSLESYLFKTFGSTFEILSYEFEIIDIEVELSSITEEVFSLIKKFIHT